MKSPEIGRAARKLHIVARKLHIVATAVALSWACSQGPDSGPAVTPSGESSSKPPSAASKPPSAASKAPAALSEQELSDEAVHLSGTSEQGSFSADFGGDIDPASVFPDDVPTYPAAKGIATVTTDELNLVRFQVPDSQSRVESFYRKELVSQGWKIELDVKRGNTHQLEASKGQRRITAVITPMGRTAMLTLTEKRG